MVKLGEIAPPLYGLINQLMNPEEMFVPATDWHDKVDHNKLRRLGEEENSIYHIVHKLMERLFNFLGENITFELQLGDPVIPWGAAIIVLVLVHKRFSNAIFILLMAFLFSINPLYVCLAYIIFWLYLNRYSKPRYTAIKSPICDDYSTYTPEPYNDKTTFASESSKEYDFTLIGNDLSTLFTAAVLSRLGHICCVLQPISAPPVSVVAAPAQSPQLVSLRGSLLGRPMQYLSILGTAVCPGMQIKSRPVGTRSNGYCYSVLRLNTEEVTCEHQDAGGEQVFVLQGGPMSLADDNLVSSVEFERVLRKALEWCHHTYANITCFLFAKCLPAKTGTNWKELFPANDAKWMDIVSGTTASDVMNSLGSSTPYCLDVLHALASTVFAGESTIPSSSLAALALISAVSLPAEGVHCVLGGYTALLQMLTKAVRYGGGRVVSSVPITGIEVKQGRASGVLVGGARRQQCVAAGRGVISGVGILCTYGRLLPKGVPLAMAGGVQEARPKMYVVLRVPLDWLRSNGSADALFCGEYIEASAPGGKSASSGSYLPGYVRIWSPEVQVGEKLTNRAVVVVEFEAGSDLVQPHRVNDDDSSPTVFVATQGPDPEIVASGCRVGDTVTLTNSQREELIAAAVKACLRAFVGEKKLECSSSVEILNVVPPSVGGHALSATVHKYAGTIKSCTPVEVSTYHKRREIDPQWWYAQGLFLCGKDVGTAGLVGEVQGGWVAATAALGYTLTELLSGRNALSDIRK